MKMKFCETKLHTLQKATPLCVLPILSRGGDHRQIPIKLGTTTIIAPDTPDLAGKPTWKEII